MSDLWEEKEQRETKIGKGEGFMFASLLIKFN